jgi:nicotinamidase/pyrazinamidase
VSESDAARGAAAGQIEIGPDCALLIVDLQVDFCPGGALAVPAGDEIVAPINRILEFFPFVVASRDYHPEDHCSFHHRGGPWPSHCVRETPGVELHPGLRREHVDLLIDKATTPEQECYSAFGERDLAAELRSRRIRHLFACGLATDYCVQASVLDALAAGFSVTLLLDCTRAVNARPTPAFEPGDGERAIRRMVDAGAVVVSSRHLR